MFERIRLFWIRYKLNLLGMADSVFPIKIISLSRKIADLESRESAYRIIKQYECHPNFYVRRAALTAIRFMGEEAAKQFLDTLLQRTSDSEAWVRYDAAWALGETKIKDDRIPIALRSVANEFANMSTVELDEFKPYGDSDYAKKRAAQSLHQYENN